MDLKKLAAKAKKTIDDRGGMDSLKADAEELKKVAKGEGSMADKAKRAAQALKEPGAGKDADAAGHRDAAPGTHAHDQAGHGHDQAGHASGQAGGGQQASGEMHPAKDLGDPIDTPRKGGPPHE